MSKKDKMKAPGLFRIDPTPENLGYLQGIYERHRSERAKQRQNQEEQLKKENQRWYIKYLCPCLKHKLDEDSDGELKETRYSSGESDASYVISSEEERPKQKDDNDIEAKTKLQIHLWQRCISKIRGAVLVLVRFGELEKRINLFGTSIKFDFDLQMELKPKWYIIMPESSFKILWNMIMIFLLMYTATVVPFRTAFIDDVSPSFESFEITVDILFGMDLFVNFVSAYMDTDRKMEIRIK